MPLSGYVGAGAQDSLEELLKRAFLEAEQQRAIQQQEWTRANTEGQQAESTRRFEVQQAGETADRAERTAERAETAKRLEATLTRQEAADRQVGNQRGVRRMLGEFVVQEGAPKTPADRATLQGMALQEDVDLPATMTGPSLEEKQAQEDATWKKRADYQENQLRTRPARPVRENLTPGQAFNATRQLRNDFVRETQAAREVQGQFTLMQSAIDAARKGDMAAGSQGVLVTFQKILDPTSVVRESEYARSASGQALLSRIEGAATRLARGGAGVPVQELERFVALAEQFAKNQANAAKETKAQIDAIAEEYGINPDNITREYGTPRVRVPLGQLKQP